MIITLCGFMGAGKSTIGRNLAKYLDFDFIDLDDYIEQKQGCTVRELFAAKGEGFFRDRELDALREIIGQYTPGVSRITGSPRICEISGIPGHSNIQGTSGIRGVSGICAAGSTGRHPDGNPHVAPGMEPNRISTGSPAGPPPGSSIVFPAGEPTGDPATAPGPARERHLILALGGGTVTVGECARIVKEQTRCIYLHCSRPALVARLAKNSAKRPLLAGKTDRELDEHIAGLVKAREEIYKSCATLIVSTDTGNVKEVVERLSRLVRA